MTRLAFIDVETTGTLDIHEPYEIGLVLRQGVSTTWYRYWLPADLAKADPNALPVGDYYGRRPKGTAWALTCVSAWSGHQEERLMTPPGAAAEIAALLAKAVLVGVNVGSFDAPMIARFLHAHGESPAWNYSPVELKSLAAGYLAGRASKGDLDAGLAMTPPPWKSSDIARAIGIDVTKFEAHTALGDARLNEAIYDAVMGGAEEP